MNLAFLVKITELKISLPVVMSVLGVYGMPG